MTLISVENDAAFSLQVMHKTGIVMVYFWAPWCEPCKMIRSEIQNAAQRFEGKVSIVNVNVDTAKSIAETYEIMAVPTLLFFEDGQPIKRIIGYASQGEIESFLAALMDCNT